MSGIPHRPRPSAAAKGREGRFVSTSASTQLPPDCLRKRSRERKKRERKKKNGKEGKGRKGRRGTGRKEKEEREGKGG